jgi:hypothetical protein
VRSLFIILLLFKGSTMLFAQSVGSIKGFVKEGDAPVVYANVYLTLKNDSTKIKSGTVTGNAGEFILEKIPLENYVLHVKMIGYVSKKMDITLTSANREIDLNTLTLEADALLLNAVEVVAAKELIQKTEDGFVIKASDNITQIGGTAADLLKNMPGVLVGADGEVTLRGKNTPYVNQWSYLRHCRYRPHGTTSTNTSQQH